MSEKSPKDVTDEELKYARIYYITGFFVMPMVWLLVVLNWWHYRKLNTEKAARMKFYIKHCFIGCIIWAVVLVVWITVFQTTWRTVPFFGAMQMMSEEGVAWQ